MSTSTGTISSSTGLISGIDIESLVTKLMKIEKQPLTLLQTRVTNTEAKQKAYETISSDLSAVLTSITKLSQSSSFTARTASSSLESALTATAGSNAALGTYSFLVKSVVSTHQMASSGFADLNTTPVGAGTLTFENSASRVDTDTELSLLNGGEGVSRGQVRITDRAGNVATIDLRAAYTMGDVLDAINSQSDASVRAYVSDDRLVIEDQTGLSSGTLKVANVSGSRTATDLGIVGSESGTGQISSASDLIRLTANSSLSEINDGQGVRYSSTGDDIRLTLANGRTFDIDLSNAVSLDTNLAELNGGQGVGAGTIRITNHAGVTKELTLTGTESLQDIQDTLASSAYADLKMTLTSVSGSGALQFKDSSTGTGELKIEDVSGTIADQLGIAGETEESTVSGTASYQMSTVTSLIRRFQYSTDASGALNNGDFEIKVSDDGKSFALVDHTSGSSSASITALSSSNALEDLGLAGTFNGGTLSGTRVASGLNTTLLKSLNGGDGVELGTSTFQLRDGSTVTLDFTGAETLQDVVNTINGQSSLHAEVSAGGTGLVLTDTTTGTGTFTASGATLDDLQISGSSTTGELKGGDLNRQYISENTVLSSLNNGEGIGLEDGDSSSTASFQITNSSGETATVMLSGTLHHTVGDVIDAINTAMEGKGVHARVNSEGDGIELYEDGTLGSGKLTVSEVNGGSVASKLHIKGEASDDNKGVLTGSFAGTVEIASTDTLQDVVEKINSAGVGVRASVINDGSSSKPYRLVITSDTSGEVGAIGFDGGTSGISLETLTEAQDARVVVGDEDSANSILISSNTNQITGVVDGVTLNLVGASDTAVQVTVGQDVDSVVSSMSEFVTAYNAVLDAVDELTSYDSETKEKGILLGESAILQIRSRLQSQLSHVLDDSNTYKTLSSVGISTLDASGAPVGGGRIRLDEEKFRKAMSEDPDAVKSLFTKVGTTTGADGKETVSYVGIAARLKNELKSLTASSDGLVATQVDRLQDQIDMFNKRIEAMETLLDQKEDRYYEQFTAMETALSNLQKQQSALSSLTGSSSSTSSSSSS